MSYTPPDSNLPAGTIVAFGGVAAPTGWLFCRGQAVEREAYPNLFNVIREYYGPGDSETTFNLPDGRGRSFIGAGQGYGESISGSNTIPTGASLTNRVIGQWGGEERHSLISTEIPVLTTNQSANAVAIDSTTLSYTTVEGFINYQGVSVVAPFTTIPLTTETVGGNSSHNNMHPWQVIGGWIIKY